MMKEYQTIDELAEMYKVDRRTLYREIQKGRLVATRIGRQWRISPEAREDYESKNRNMSKKELAVFMKH